MLFDSLTFFVFFAAVAALHRGTMFDQLVGSVSHAVPRESCVPVLLVPVRHGGRRCEGDAARGSTP